MSAFDVSQSASIRRYSSAIPDYNKIKKSDENILSSYPDSHERQPTLNCLSIQSNLPQEFTPVRSRAFGTPSIHRMQSAPIPSSSRAMTILRSDEDHHPFLHLGHRIGSRSNFLMSPLISPLMTKSSPVVSPLSSDSFGETSTYKNTQSSAHPWRSLSLFIQEVWDLPSNEMVRNDLLI